MKKVALGDVRPCALTRLCFPQGRFPAHSSQEAVLSMQLLLALKSLPETGEHILNDTHILKFQHVDFTELGLQRWKDLIYRGGGGTGERCSCKQENGTHIEAEHGSVSLSLTATWAETGRSQSSEVQVQ